MTKLRISEIFGPTIQGEGALIGKPTVFVRAGGCDYRCSWCDTLYAVDSEFRREWKQMSSEEIWASVQKLSGGSPLTVSLSGGNPAIQDFSAFITLANQHGYDVAMETQGSIYRKWFTKLQHLAISPKPPSAQIQFDPEKLDECVKGGPKNNTVLKIVIFDDQDYKWAKEVAGKYPELPLFLQAGNLSHMDNYSEVDDPVAHACKNTQTLIEKALSDGWFRPKILPQLHVMIWGNERGV
ncbi:7-carboxy-7-deazaguanine synthase QueE [Alphaproteobacteria bacterium]|nr:7-carboxy-7-deazaguanine synthase QueE [Alphaproteobacteria bacterium]